MSNQNSISVSEVAPKQPSNTPASSIGVVRRSRAEWRKIVRAFKTSGLKAPAYSRAQGVSLWNLRWWVREFARAADLERKPKAPKFIELHLPEQQAEYQAEYQITVGTRQLLLRGSFSTERVAQLIKLLDGAA